MLCFLVTSALRFVNLVMPITDDLLPILHFCNPWKKRVLRNNEKEWVKRKQNLREKLDTIVFT